MFSEASMELHTDEDYMSSLNLPSNADTPTVAIAGGFLAGFFAGLGHLVTHTIFLIWTILKKDFQEVRLNLFEIGGQRGKDIAIILFAGLISGIWIYDFLVTLKIKLFLFNLIFMGIAIAVTFIYAIWIKNLADNRSTLVKMKAERTTK